MFLSEFQIILLRIHSTDVIIVMQEIGNSDMVMDRSCFVTKSKDDFSVIS